MIKTLILIVVILLFAYLIIWALTSLLYKAKREEDKDYQIRNKQKQALTDAALNLRRENERLTNTKEKL